MATVAGWQPATRASRRHGCNGRLRRRRKSDRAKALRRPGQRRPPDPSAAVLLDYCVPRITLTRPEPIPADPGDVAHMTGDVLADRVMSCAGQARRTVGAFDCVKHDAGRVTRHQRRGRRAMRHHGGGSADKPPPRDGGSSPDPLAASCHLAAAGRRACSAFGSSSRPLSSFQLAQCLLTKDRRR